MWCNGYHLRKWRRWSDFKSWTRLCSFHVATIRKGKVWIQKFTLIAYVIVLIGWYTHTYIYIYISGEKLYINPTVWKCTEIKENNIRSSEDDFIYQKICHYKMFRFLNLPQGMWVFNWNENDNNVYKTLFLLITYSFKFVCLN